MRQGSLVLAGIGPQKRWNRNKHPVKLLSLRWDPPLGEYQYETPTTDIGRHGTWPADGIRAVGRGSAAQGRGNRNLAARLERDRI
jgi:hypothetical protein